MEIEQLLRQLSIFDNKEVLHEPLNGGFANQTYKLTCEGKCYVLRHFGQQTDYLHLPRASEIDATRAMNPKVNSQNVLYFDPSEEYVLLEYINGRQVASEDLLDSRMCRLILSHLKKIHDHEDPILLKTRQCSPYHLVESYLKGADQLNVKRPEGMSLLLQKMNDIANSRRSDTRYTNKFCHNDYYTFNLIWSSQNQTLHVIDWELCGAGDVFFDLATIPFTNGFTPMQEKQWLTMYFGDYEEEQYAILQDMKFMNMMRECSWGLLHSGLVQQSVNHSFDYYKHAERVIDRLQRGINYL